MVEQISLKRLERKAFNTASQDGLWDILIGCIILVFAIAPLLSVHLGDFWSSVVFLPFWGVVALIIRGLRRRVVEPRIGVVTFGPARRARLSRFTTIMVFTNLVALLLGIYAASNSGVIRGNLVIAFAGFIFLTGFSIASHFLEFNRLFVYGLLAGGSPILGEWLFVEGKASHHGFPITFGVTAAIMIITGLVVFIRLVLRYPVPPQATATGGN